MSISEARKILGKLSENMSDADVLLEIENASLLKDLFFKMYKDGIRKKHNVYTALVKTVQ